MKDKIVVRPGAQERAAPLLPIFADDVQGERMPGVPGGVPMRTDDPAVVEPAQPVEQGPVFKRVLVYLDTRANVSAAARTSVRDLAQEVGGKVKYEYTVVLPNVMALRNLTPEAIERLKAIPGVDRVEEDVYHPNLVKLHDATPLVRGLQSQIAAAGLSASGAGIRVCVADTGIDSDHVMYASRIDTSAGWDFYNDDSNPEDDHGHGSHVSGIAVGAAGLSVDFGCGAGSQPFQGMAPQATLIGVKILNASGGGFDSDIIAGINHCADQSPSGGRADVINLSIGTGNFTSGACTHSWAVAANNAVANGVVVVAASGNENNSNSMGSPACGASVIAVGATYKADYPTCEDNITNWNWGDCVDNSPNQDQIVCFSNESDFLDVAAPGSNIWSASNAAGGGSITGMSGTSMASPMVAGLAALILSADPSLTPQEVRQIIRDGAIDMGPPGFDRAYGWGRIDAINSLQLVGPGCSTDPECDDSNDCTDDACVAGSCQNTNNNDACDDGLFCTVIDACSGGSCVGSGDPCTGGLFCNETTDTCDDVDCIDNADCDDANACTTDTCVGGTCLNDCPANVSSYPYSENFESGLGAWSNVGGDTFDWTRDASGTPSSSTGPSGDHTTGSGWYMYIETSSPRVLGDFAILQGPCFDLVGGSGADLTFWYHMYGATIGTLDVEVSDDCSSWTNVWSLSSNQGNAWFQASVDLSAWVDSTISIRFVGTRGSSYTGDIAIDDISVDVSAPNCSTDPDCDDGLYCNGAETCVAGNCQSGTPPNCSDGVGCTDDSCNEGTDSCDNVANNGNCDNGQFCDGSETCDPAFDCQAGTAPNCNDGVGCTDDSCNEGTDSCDNVANNGNCDDGLFCNGSETCHITLDCQSGSAPNCDDSIPCTNDSCNEGTDSCDHTPTDALCENGLFCDGAETCNATLGCQSAGDPCDDGVGCTDDSCNEGSDSCSNVANDGNCDDALFCNGAETCHATLDCQSGSNPCLGGEFCNEGSDTCESGECVVDADCDDGSDCTSDTCAGGVCFNDCPGSVSSYPYAENFESGLGAWSNVGGDVFDWTRDASGTPSSNTGPSGDHTTGSGWYMYTETSSPRVQGDFAVFESPCFDLTAASNADLSFWYHMYGATIGTLDVEVSDDCSSWTNVWSLSGNQGNVWSQANVDLSAWTGSTITIRFVGTRGSSYTGDIAIDDVSLDAVLLPTCSVGADCDDANACTDEACVGGLCQYTNNSASCDDGQFCTVSDVCAGGSCVGSGDPCPGQFCNEATDSCDDVQCIVDADCDDSSDCTSDSCVDGQCFNDCPANVSSYPYSETFESGFGAWANVGGDVFDWTRDASGTPSSNTGPSGDHTTGSGWYMYIETSSPRQSGDTAVLEGPCFDLGGASDADLSFWYHMYGGSIGTLDVEVSDDCSSWTNVWTLSGNQGNTWTQANVDLSAWTGSTITIRFIGTRGSSWQGDIAIDDVSVTATP